MKTIGKWMAILFCAIAGVAQAAKQVVNGIEWNYSVENGVATITGDSNQYGILNAAISTSTAGKIVIPNTLGGCPVKSVGSNAFSDCKKITSVTIPSCVTNICGCAFINCDGLKSVVIPEGVEVVERPFCWCDNLTSISLPASLKRIVYCLAYSCDKIEVINIPANLETIERWNLGESAGLLDLKTRDPSIAYDCEGLSKITVDPANRYFIVKDGALFTKDMTELLTCPDQQTTLNIPASVQKISWSGIQGDKLKNIIVDPANKTYSSIDGMLCDKSGETLLKCPANRTLVSVPPGIKTIDWAIVGSTVTEIHLPASVLDAEYLGYVRKLKKITVDAANPNYSSKDGVLYDKEMTRLVHCPNCMETLELPETVVLLDSVSYDDRYSSLKTIIFHGAPPELPSSWVGYKGFFEMYYLSPQGYYTSYASEWEDVIVDGKWEGLPMQRMSDIDIANIEDSYGPYVPGEKVSVTVDELIGYTAKGLPTGLKLNAKTGEISGTPTKPTGDAGVTVTFTKKGAETLKATFIVSDWPQVSVSCEGLANAKFTVGVAGDGEAIPVEIEPLSAVKSVKASKLPSGMKLVKDKTTGEWSITGSPTKAGTYNVVLTVTTTYGSKQTLTFPVTVEALPSWAVGTFGGVLSAKIEGESRFYGTVALTVAKTGKLSAKISAGGKTYSLSAAGFTSADDGVRYRFRMTSKAGDVYEGELSASQHDVKTILLRENDYSDSPGCFTPNGQQPYDAWIWRNEHGKDGHIADDSTGRLKRTFDAIKAFKTVNLSEWDPAYGSVKMTIKANGTTSISGTTADGVKLSATGFLKLDGPTYHIIADLVAYDKKSAKVYSGAICWEPVFAADGSVSGWTECCDHSLKSYPFVQNGTGDR